MNQYDDSQKNASNYVELLILTVLVTSTFCAIVNVLILSKILHSLTNSNLSIVINLNFGLYNETNKTDGQKKHSQHCINLEGGQR